MQKRIIIVLGMHRSGTSALTRGLTVLGADPGTHLMGPIPDNNEKGFFEDLDLYALNEELLDSLGRTWQTLLPVLPEELDGSSAQQHKLDAITLLRSKIKSTDIFCMKDPRFSYLLPFWQDICERLDLHVSYVIATRNPLSVTQSLSKRDGTDPGKSYYLWLEHMLSSITHTIGKEYIVVDYDNLITDPARQLHRISNSLALNFDPDSPELNEYKNDFLEVKLQHSRFETGDLMLDDNIPEEVRELYIALKAVAEDHATLDDPPMLALLQKLQKQKQLLRPALSTIQRFEDKSCKLAQWLIERNQQIANFDDSLNQAAVEIDTLKQTVVESDSQIDKLNQAVADRNNQIDILNQAIVDRDKTISSANQSLTDLLNSNSWRLTRSLRSIRHHMITSPSQLLRSHLSSVSSKAWRKLPLSPNIKIRTKNQLFNRLPILFKNSTAYKNWSALSAYEFKTGDSLLNPYEHETYVPLHCNEALANPSVQLIAFYLPQFHSIPENDEWWGKGFTEWTNVKPAEPQYRGHYQPHVPGELGYYDLKDVSIQKRQIELAQIFGVGGFCFYFYWFAGKRLLETPVLNYLNDASLDFPFCLCWANENWSRRWDGLENEILISQEHSPEDDLAFIEYVSEYMRDSRYIRINSRPLLLVYRPCLLPTPKETVERWRTWCKNNGIGEIYLAYTQSFEKENPEIYGFDAAVEFPPNNSGPPIITEQAEELNPDFTGTIYDWSIFTERSKDYKQPDYTLFRGVTPCWDNTARRKTNGTIFANSSPEDYQAWLARSIEDTLTNQHNKDEQLVFINAWNEWAEGAHLEPDKKYGYAYLQATRNALENTANENNKRRILLVIHDAHPHGAQYLILNMAKVLKESMGFIVELIVLDNGPLMDEYSKHANVHELRGNDLSGSETTKLIQQLRKKGLRSAITNTTATGLIIPALKQNGFTVVALIHELPQLIKDYQLQDHVHTIAKLADKVVFAASAVREGFESFVKLDEEKIIMKPQGLYKKNSLQTTQQRQVAHYELRQRFRLADDAQIILSVGFADYRKGIDLFVEAGIELLSDNNNIYFLWLGIIEPTIEDKIKQTINKSGFTSHFIFPGMEYDSDIYYAGSNIYALTSREDPFPSVVLEALDSYTPVVSFANSGGASELLSRGGGLLVEEPSSKGFSIALNSLISNTQKAQQLALEGKKIIDEEFSFRKYLFELADIAQTGLHRISVVVPNYNYDQYIEDRLQSIFNQNHPIYEIIILDDASSDRSVNIIKNSIKKQDIDCQLIINKENSGNVFKQWSKGVSVATGDYVWIAEADDLSDPEFLKEVLKGFDDKGVVLSYCESKQIDSTGNIMCGNYLDYISDISQQKWLGNYTAKGIGEIRDCLAIKNTIPNVSAIVFKRKNIAQVLQDRLDEIVRYKNAGDWVTYIHTLSDGDITYSSKALNKHRRHENSVTLNAFDISQLKEIMSVQRLTRDNYSLDEKIIHKQNAYAQKLYEQFNLSSNDHKTITDHSELSVFFQ